MVWWLIYIVGGILGDVYIRVIIDFGGGAYFFCFLPWPIYEVNMRSADILTCFSIFSKLAYVWIYFDKVPPNGKCWGQRIKSPIFLTLSKKEQRSNNENNRAKIWIDQMYRAFKILTAIISVQWDYRKFCKRRLSSI